MGERKLTGKQEKFCIAMMGEANGSATEAARIAGYKGDDRQLQVQGSNNLSKPIIQNRLAELRKPAVVGGLREIDNRVDGYVHRLDQFAQIVRERRADEDYGTAGDLGYEPGAKSGWLARKIKITRRTFRSKDGAETETETVEVEYKFDAGLAREMRELEKQLATELGQWSERKEVTGKGGGPLSVVEVEVLKQLLPPEVRELHDEDDDDSDEDEPLPMRSVLDVVVSDNTATVDSDQFEGWAMTGFDDD